MSNRKTRDRQLSKLAARRAAERRKKRRQRGVAFGVAGAVAAIGLSVLLVALLHNPKKTPSAHPSPTTPSPSAAAVACGGSVPSSSLVKKPTFNQAPKMTIDDKKTYTATMVTSCGTIQMQLFAKDAPIAVNNFVFLAKQHFYDGLTFHRIVKGFVIQGGDPEGTGSGGPGYSFKDELKNDLTYETGTLAMANSGPDTNGSQFFIVASDSGAKQLTKSYTIFGKVTSGMDVVTAINNIATTTIGQRQDVPTQTVYILKVTISTS